MNSRTYLKLLPRIDMHLRYWSQKSFVHEDAPDCQYLLASTAADSAERDGRTGGLWWLLLHRMANNGRAWLFCCLKQWFWGTDFFRLGHNSQTSPRGPICSFFPNWTYCQRRTPDTIIVTNDDCDRQLIILVVYVYYYISQTNQNSKFNDVVVFVTYTHIISGKVPRHLQARSPRMCDRTSHTRETCRPWTQWHWPRPIAKHWN
jgi:hypothetical protein